MREMCEDLVAEKKEMLTDLKKKLKLSLMPIMDILRKTCMGKNISFLSNRLTIKCPFTIK